MFKTGLYPFSVLILISTALLSACGGGGGGSNAAGSGSPSLSLSTENVSFSANRDDPVPPGNITITASATNGKMYIGVSSGASVACNNTSSCIITVFPPGNPNTMSPGTTYSTITVNGYDTQLSTTPTVTKTINVAYTITDGLTLYPATLSFNAVESEIPAMQSLDLSSTEALSWSLSKGTYSGGDWLFTSLNSGTTNSRMDVSVGPKLAGSYSGYLNFSHNLSTGIKTASVSYLVEPMLNANPVSFTISETSQPADLIQNMVISTNPKSISAPNVGWTASIDKAWVSSSVANGDTASLNSIDLTLGVSELNKLVDGNYQANLTLTPANPSYSPISVPVSLSMSVPQFNYISPDVVYTGSTTPLIVRGEKIGTNLSEVLLGGNPIGVTQVDSTKLEFNQPVLANGSYLISRTIPTGINNSKALLTVVDPQTFPYYAVALAGSKDRILFDAKRNAILVASRSAQKLHRLVYNGKSWDLTSVDIPNIYDIDLTPDSNVLLATNSQQILHLDPVTLKQIKAVTPTTYDSFTRPKSIRVLNSGEALITLETNNNTQNYVEYRKYSLLDDSFSALATIAAIDTPVTIQSNPIRDRLVVTHDDGGVSAFLVDDNMNRNGGSGGTRIPNYMHLSATGDRGMCMEKFWAVTQSTMTYLASLADGGTTLRSVISIDGKKAYTYDVNATVRTFDLLDTTDYWTRPEIGTGVTIPDPPGTNVHMIITPDGNNIVIAGDSNLIVTPVP